MNLVELLAGEQTPENYALTSAMALEHLGHLFTFLDARMGELVMFDPEAQTKERVIREAIKVGSLVCNLLAKDGESCGTGPEVMRELWEMLVEEAVRRSADPDEQGRREAGEGLG